MVELNLDNWNNFIRILSRNRELSEDDAENFADEYELPLKIVEDAIDLEIRLRKSRTTRHRYYSDWKLAKDRLDTVRSNSSKTVNIAVKAANQMEKSLEEETKRADNAEKESVNLRRQLEDALEVLHNRKGGISEIELYLKNLDAKTFKSFRRIIIKALHPDKNKSRDAFVTQNINHFFGLVNKVFDKVVKMHE